MPKTLKLKIQFEEKGDESMKRNITYTEHEGRLYPDLELPDQEQMMIGRFGRKHKTYLKKCKKLIYFRLLTSGELTSYLANIYR